MNTHGLMVETNKELRGQRDLITDASDKAHATDAQVARTGKLVAQMTKSEYYGKLMIMGTIVLLAAADIGMGVYLLTKPFR